MAPTEAKVELVRWTPEPEQIVESAAKLCYAADAAEVFEHGSGSTGKFVKMLRKLGHMSPVEHAVFTFYIEGVSRAMTHQLVRHRMASYSQRSQRYVKHGAFDYVVPPQLEGRTVDDGGKTVAAADYYRETMEWIGRRYERLVAALGDRGESSNEDARYVLPNACETKIFVTMNARELIHFMGERLCERAQWEIRHVAEMMLEQAKSKCPSLFDGIGPKCVQLGRCPEGKMSCGRFAEKMSEFAGPSPA